MPKTCYVPHRFNAAALEIIDTAEKICDEYSEAGYDLTLRQLYYQFVSKGMIANKDSEYKRLGDIINTARLAGLIDWDHITDRTRNLKKLSTWDSPGDIIRACADQYRIDKWDTQKIRVEVWVEKEALAGVIQRPCERYNVPWFCCRGYVSQSEMWSAAQRLIDHVKHGQSVLIIHLGDHDPSGIDMTRDIADRLKMFAQDIDVIRDQDLDLDDLQIAIERIALNMIQIDRYSPPPNPAKLSDSRSTDYIEKYGDESWELDALDPSTIDKLIDRRIKDCIDPDCWDDAVAEEDRAKRKLKMAAANVEA